MQGENFSDEQLRTQLIEAILEYLEGNRTLRSVLVLGLITYNGMSSKNSKLAEVVSQLNTIGNKIADNKSISGESIKETFTNMLEKLISD